MKHKEKNIFPFSWFALANTRSDLLITSTLTLTVWKEACNSKKKNSCERQSNIYSHSNFSRLAIEYIMKRLKKSGKKSVIESIYNTNKIVTQIIKNNE